MKEIQFVDSGSRLVDAVADWLCDRFVQDTPSGVRSLAHVLVAVPTAQSGRCLRLALARRSAAKGWGGLLPPHVAMPNELLSDRDQLIATEAEEIVALAEVLLTVDFSDFPVLFPREHGERGL